MTIYIVWPERRHVSEDQIASWYADAVANGMVPANPDVALDVNAMAAALDDAGLITRGRNV